MKTILTAIAMGIAGVLSPLIADQPRVQTKIDVSFEKVDAKWFADLDQSSKALKEGKGGAIKIPSVTATSGQAATIQIIKEYKTRTSTHEAPIVPCGVIISLTPRLNGQEIHLVGTSVLRRSINKLSTGSSSGLFQAQEVLVDSVFKDGESKLLALENGGRIRITATIVDATGRPMKE